ncbi:MAG: hypothetical protein R3E79_24285 [Caldilineaceae bacterium]
MTITKTYFGTLGVQNIQDFELLIGREEQEMDVKADKLFDA